MLEGNISRMCVTNDLNELSDMYKYAKDRLVAILKINHERLKEDKGNA